MATYEKIHLSADSTGDGVWLDFSASPVTVHTTGTSATVLDEVWLYVANYSSGNTANITIQFGAVGAVRYSIGPSTGLVLLVPGLLVSGTGSAGRTISVTDNSSTGECYVFGYVNRITP